MAETAMAGLSRPAAASVSRLGRIAFKCEEHAAPASHQITSSATARTRSSTSSAFAVAAKAAVLSKMHQTSADFAACTSVFARASRY